MKGIQGERRVKLRFSPTWRFVGPVLGRGWRSGGACLGAAVLALGAAGCAPSQAPRSGPQRPTVLVGANGTSSPVTPQELESAAPRDRHPAFEVRREEVGQEGDVVVSLEFPSFGAPGGDQRRQAQAAELSQRVRAIFVSQMKDFEGHGPDSQQGVAGGLPPWSLHIKCDVTGLSPSLVSMACSEHSYTGGAHGNQQTRGYTFTLLRRQVQQLSLDDLFTIPQQGRAKLSKLCLQDLESQEAEGVVSGSVTDLREMIEQFALAPDGMRVFFPPYSVAPYAAGQYTVLVPYKQLEALLRQHPPVYTMLRELK